MVQTAIHARDLEKVLHHLNQLEVNVRQSQPQFSVTAGPDAGGYDLLRVSEFSGVPASSCFSMQIKSEPQYSSASKTGQSGQVAPKVMNLNPISSTPLAPMAAPVISPQVSPVKKKYYVILVVKCTGIYFGVWESVEPFVLGVHGARHKSFTTYDLAQEFYLGAKKLGKVKIVRDPGDNERFGSIELEDAVQ